MNAPELPKGVVPELPKGYRQVESVEPEAGEVSAAFLSNPKDKSTNRMRKNMKALRTRITPSHGPIVKIEDTEGGFHGYAWNTAAGISDDSHLENRLMGLTARQLIKLCNRTARRALRLEEKASRINTPAIARQMLDQAGRLRNVGSSARLELTERTAGGGFLNPDGN